MKLNENEAYDSVCLKQLELSMSDDDTYAVVH